MTNICAILKHVNTLVGCGVTQQSGVPFLAEDIPKDTRMAGVPTRGPKQKHCIPGLGAPVLRMLPLLPLVDKRVDFVSGSQGSDKP